MPPIQDFKTIPEMFDVVTKTYGSSKTYLKIKIDGKYVDVTYQEVRDITENLSIRFGFTWCKKRR